MSFGQELQRQRVLCEISLEEVAAGTRVPVRHLRALEGDDYTELPGGVFNKGIVRSYCRHLGLEEETWLARMPAEVSGEDASAEWAEFAEAVQRNRAEGSRRNRRRWWGVLLMFAGLAALVWLAWRFAIGPRVHSTPGPVGTASASAMELARSSRGDPRA